MNAILARRARRAAEQLAARHPGTEMQFSAHGAGRWSVQFFGQQGLVADYDLRPPFNIEHSLDREA